MKRPGKNGGPRKRFDRVFNFLLSKSDWDKLRTIAEATESTPSEVLRQLIRQEYNANR